VCPSCGAKRAAELAAFLQNEVVGPGGHAQWVFTIPKMLRIYFLHHRELLGALSLAAYQTVEELMAAAVEEKSLRPGVVSVIQTFGEGARFHPHVHALCSRGGWTASGEWIPLPYVDEGAAEKLFRHKVLALLRRRGLLSQERIELLNSWRRSGFSVHNRVFVHPRDQSEFEALVRYNGVGPEPPAGELPIGPSPGAPDLRARIANDVEAQLASEGDGKVPCVMRDGSRTPSCARVAFGQMAGAPFGSTPPFPVVG